MNNKIDSLILDGNETFDFINEALSFSNVNDLEFRNCDFFTDDLLKLIDFKQYNRVAFVECTFEDENLLKNIKTKSISLTNNKIANYNFVYDMNNLENLTIVGGSVDAYKINSLKNLKYLRLSHSNIINIKELHLDKLKYLFIDNTNILDISFIKKFSKLQLLSISEEQRLLNKEFISIIKNHIHIILDSIIEMEVYDDE